MKKNNLATEALNVVGIITATLHDHVTGKIRKVVFHNQVVETGLAELVKAIMPGEAKVEATHIAIGDGNTAVASTDTALDNEVFRVALQYPNAVGNTLYLSAYIGQTQYVGDVSEMGVILGGTATAGSGTLFNRISEESGDFPLNKSNTESLTIDYALTINNSSS